MNRIFVGWQNGDFLTLCVGMPDDSKAFHDLVAENGPPHIVEFRAKGEGYVTGPIVREDDETEDLPLWDEPPLVDRDLLLKALDKVGEFIEDYGEDNFRKVLSETDTWPSTHLKLKH